MQRRGSDWECFVSRQLGQLQHLEPVIVPAHFLRSIQLGQIDLLFYDHQWSRLLLIEAKSSLRISKSQTIRLKRAANYLGELFSCPVHVMLAYPTDLPKALALIKL